MPVGHVNDSPPSCDKKMQGHNRNAFKGQLKRSKILNGWNPKVTYNSLSLITQIRNKLNKCFPKFGNNSKNVHHQTHQQLSVLSTLAQLFILPVTISLLFPSSLLDTNWPGGLIFWYHVFLPFHTVHGVLEARILEWFAIPSSRGPHFVRTLHYDPSVALKACNIMNESRI